MQDGHGVEPEEDSRSGAEAERTAWLVQYQPWLRLLARLEIDNRFRGKFSASDVVQQTLMEAWRDWNAFRGESSPQRLAWLRQILAHQLAHFGRRYGATLKRDVRRELSLEQSLAQSSLRLAQQLAADTASPSIKAEENEQQLLLARILEQLPHDYREVIVLRNLQGLAHAEVAERMGRSEGAVRMLWVRALSALREGMERVNR